MASNWTNTQREGWLSQLYGQEYSDGTRVLQSNTVQSRLLDVLDNLIALKLLPEDAATNTASLVLSQTDVSTPWANVVGLVLDAAATFDDEKVLDALTDYLVEMASLPDAVNEGPEAKTIDIGGGELWYAQPGKAIVFSEGKLWRDLPMYSWNVTECFQGPEQHLKVHGGSSEPLEAMQKWKNLNTYLALMAVHPKAQTIPVLAGKARLAFTTLAMALEYPPNSRFGRNSELHAPAAAQWLRIAGNEIERLCEEGTKQYYPGDLWKDRAIEGSRCNRARLAFWKSRLTEMGY